MDQQNQQQWTYPENQPQQYAPLDDTKNQTQFTPQFTPDPPRKKRNGVGKVVALALCFSLLGSAFGAGGMYLILEQLRENGTISGGKDPSVVNKGDRESSVIELHEIDTGKLMTPAEVYAANVNSTVGITTSINTNFFGYQTTSAASGSGFILSEDGYILTNHHVIEDSSSITVSFYDGTSLPAKLIGYDASNDIAVLKVEAEDLTPVVLGDSENLNVGDSVVAIGNPLGELTFSLTTGAISALDRDVTISTGATMRLMQTDCAINSGNSGGALFNLYGEVIGITNAKYSGSGSSGEASIDNIGFAIPINNVWDIVESLIEKGYISKPYIGVTVSDVSAESQSYGLPQGAAVRSVLEDSPAEKAGLKSGDIITHADGKEISGSNALVSLVGEREIGDTLELTVYRQGKTLELQLKIGEQIQEGIQTPESNSTQNQPSPPKGYGY